ncbi:MAG TPA: NADP-dependent oxidoreductase [Bryobacteraceae bacterium]|nr:NADP-dependent oxidoreductase [Bryobacteraceae bacterium]
MKAVQLHGYGDVDQLRYEDVPTPEPGPGEVLVKVFATSINPVDWKLRQGHLKEQIPLSFPAILGRDVSGEVVAVGAGVSHPKVGDKVMGLVNRSYAEYLTAKAEVLALVPDGLNREEAGALPLVTLTGAQLIEQGVKPKSGDRVLVTGAAGGVGRTAVHVAKKHGAYVIAGVRDKQKREAEGLGADEVVALDKDQGIACLKNLDAIADTIDGETIEKLIPTLKRGGVLASVLGKPSGAEKADIRVEPVWAQPDASRLRQLAEDIQKREFKMPISNRFRLSQAAEAQKFAEKGASGKVLLVP